MGVFDEFLILPGVVTDIVSDYSSGYDTSLFGTTDAVTVIGTAFNGPVGKPVAIYSPEHAKYIFGSTFDSKNRREATLVAEIKDAWDRGCRTIYGVRMSGKDIYKDFQLATDTTSRLRVSGLFPNNSNKDVFFELNAADSVLDMANGVEPSIKIFKPATRATIEEKVLGKVIKEDSILTNSVKLRSNWNVTATTRLVDFIRLFNEYKYNNVIKLEIVNPEGDVITDTVEAQTLSFADLLPGVYFIGRDKNSDKITVKTEMDVKFVPEEDRADVYEGFQGSIYKTLKVNTDVTKDLPIVHRDMVQLRKLIERVEDVTMVKLFDFLEVPGKVDSVWLKDKVDYEEVTIDDFEAYKSLGSGFANTAKIIETKEGSGIYKVVEVKEDSDVNRIAPINDGIYSMLENLKSDYRVLSGKYADTEIKGRLPKKAEFLVSNASSNTIFAGVVRATSKLDKKDLSLVPKKYKFALRALEEDSDLFSIDATIENLYKKSGEYTVAKFAHEAENIEAIDVKEFKEGDLIIAGKVMHRIVDGAAVKLTDIDVHKSEFKDKLIVTKDSILEVDAASVLELGFVKVVEATKLNGANLMLADVEGKIIVFAINKQDSVITGIQPLALLEDIINESTEIFTVMVPEIEEGHLVNSIELRIANLETSTLEELVIGMNESLVGEKFEFNIDSSLPESARYMNVFGEDGIFEEKIEDLINVEANTVTSTTGNTAIEDRGMPVYDKSMYIPYKTTDNFARQLAQHCIYTGLKTSSTHGVIGCTKLITSNLKTISDRVEKLTNLDLGLYAKRSNGNDMLDKSNLPYPIGRAISVTFFQNEVEADNYTYVGSGASAYAGMASKLPIDQSSTSQPIDVTGTLFELNNYQLGLLVRAGYVVIKNSFTQGYVIADGVTMAPATSPFRRLAVARVMKAVDNAIREAGEPFISKQNTLANRNSLQTAIKSLLDKLKGNLIEKYDFKVVVDRSAEQMGILEIEYTIVPIYEIREVRNRLTVSSN